MVLTEKDINNIYTTMIQAHIKRGYWINSRTMNGTQGEIAKVDLTNGKHIIRIMLIAKSNFCEELPLALFSTYKMMILEFDYTNEEFLNNNKGRLLYEEWWYMIGSKNKAFTNNKQECIALKEKSIARKRLNKKRIDENYKELNRYNADIIVDIVNKRKGKTFCRKEDIDKVIRHTYGYTIKLKTSHLSEVVIPFKHKFV